MNKLKVVALISGGKDSLYSILHCIANGHDVVALANLHPSLQGEEVAEDVDSFMYQTVGHHILPLYQQALGLPLYRQEIQGHAVSAGKTYEFGGDDEQKQKPDETESLLLLLQHVLKAHPEVNAVCSGAILSDYQRTRVESVASRLKLTSLAYLWQYPRIVIRNPRALLEDMAAAGQEARIIKVSSGGLDKSFLWTGVTNPHTTARLMKASQRFGDLDNGAVLGEGGEYETLAISGPSPVWKGCIAIEEKDIQYIAGEAGSAFVRIQAARVDMDHCPSPMLEPVRQPPILVQPYSTLLNVKLDDHVDLSGATLPPVEDNTRVVADDHMIRAIVGTGLNAAEQTDAIMTTIQARLHDAGCDFDDVAYTSIILRDMTDFGAVNTVYARRFIRPNPPARMTLACAAVLAPGCHVSISVTCRRLDDSKLRQGLHVQSISYWAPANIGPYSQAISLPISKEDQAAIVYIAGQIPLLPSSMSPILPVFDNDGFFDQAVLSLQHLSRIGIATSVRYWLHAVAFVTAPDHTEALRRAQSVRHIWRSMFDGGDKDSSDDADESDECFDVWHQRYGQQRQDPSRQDPHIDATPLKSNDLWEGPAPPLVVFQVDRLPRDVSVEWVGFGTTSSTGPNIIIPHYQHILKVFASQAL